jgi:hypothetical protein
MAATFIALSGVLLSTAALIGNNSFAGKLSAISAPATTARAAHSAAGETAAVEGGVARNSTLSGAHVSSADNGRIIIIQSARGDLPGVLTLALDVNGQDGSITGGEWALVVTDNQSPAGHSHDHGDGDGGPDYMVIQRGVLKGAVAGGAVTLNSDGTLASVSSVQLTLNGGTLEFVGATSGGGVVNAANLQDPHHSSGSITINY